MMKKRYDMSLCHAHMHLNIFRVIRCRLWRNHRLVAIRPAQGSFRHCK